MRDGRDDDRWRGHEITPLEGTPAYAAWQARTIKAILGREGYGADGITDLFYINFKTPDKAGHTWNMIAPEQKDAVRSVDDAIGDLIRWLDENVGKDNYVFTITADHGQTPLEAGGWPINRAELLADVSRRFDRTDNGSGVIQRTSASSFFMDPEEMRANAVTPEGVSAFLSRYTIRDNVPEAERLPAGFGERGGERIFSAVFPGRKLKRISACVAGS